MRLSFASSYIFIVVSLYLEGYWKWQRVDSNDFRSKMMGNPTRIVYYDAKAFFSIVVTVYTIFLSFNAAFY